MQTAVSENQPKKTTTGFGTWGIPSFMTVVIQSPNKKKSA